MNKQKTIDTSNNRSMLNCSCKDCKTKLRRWRRVFKRRATLARSQVLNHISGIKID